MKRISRKILAALFLLVLTLALSSTAQAQQAPVECTSAIYYYDYLPSFVGVCYCSQCFVYDMTFGWVPLSGPVWDCYLLLA